MNRSASKSASSQSREPLFTTEIIIKCPLISKTARRTTWMGCNIGISKVAKAGKVLLTKNAQIINQ